MTELEKIKRLEKLEKEKEISEGIGLIKRVFFHSMRCNASPDKHIEVGFIMVLECRKVKVTMMNTVIRKCVITRKKRERNLNNLIKVIIELKVLNPELFR